MNDWIPNPWKFIPAILVGATVGGLVLRVWPVEWPTWAGETVAFTTMFAIAEFGMPKHPPVWFFMLSLLIGAGVYALLIQAI
jgi:hypothetical protein